MRQFLFSAVVASVFCFSANGVEPETQPATQPATPTPHSRWLVFPSGAPYHFIRSVNSRYIWMKGGNWCGQVQRYDMKERKLTTFTARDGLPIDTSGVLRLMAGNDDRCLLLLERVGIPVGVSRLYLYSDRTGWRALPLFDKNQEVKDTAFDTNGDVIAMVTEKIFGAKTKTCGIFRLYKERWAQRKLTKIPGASVIIPFPRHYLIKGYDGKCRLFRVEKSSEKAPVAVTDALFDENKLKYFRMGGKVYMATPPKRPKLENKEFPRIRTVQIIREITPNGLVETNTGTPQYVDLAAGAFKPMRISTAPGPKISFRVDGIETYEFGAIERRGILPVRDLNGDIWLHDRAYIDGKWQTRAPKPEIMNLEAARPDRAFYDAKAGKWKRTVHADNGMFSLVDPKKKIAWVMKDRDDKMMRLMDLSGAKPRVLRQVQRGGAWSLPNVRDRWGRWWLLDHGGIVRLDPDGKSKRYPLSMPGGVWCASKTGSVWASGSSNYFKYDPKKDKFLPSKLDILYDEQAFKISGKEYSVLPRMRYSWTVPTIVQKTGGKWEQFRHAARMGDRLMVNRKDGVWEYDGTRNRAVRLHSVGAFLHLAFDLHGRRVLANHHGVLLYDGDPFDDPHYLKYASLIETDKVSLDSCVMLLASLDGQVRQFARRRIESLSPMIGPAIQAAAHNDQLPEQTRALLIKALKNMSNTALPPGLFEAVYPRCKPYKRAQSGAEPKI